MIFKMGNKYIETHIFGEIQVGRPRKYVSDIRQVILYLYAMKISLSDIIEKYIHILTFYLVMFTRTL